MPVIVSFCASAELASLLGLEDALDSGADKTLAAADVRAALTRALSADALAQAAAHTRALIVTRSFSKEDAAAVDEAITELDSQFLQRPNARCKLDVVVLTGSLFDESGRGEESPETATYVASLGERLHSTTGFDQTRIWLVGGVSESGRIFSVTQVATVLRDFLQGTYLDAVPGAADGLFALGSRMVVFPRERAMNHLRDVFAKTVLEREPGVGADLPEIAFAAVAKDCTDFVEGHFALEMRKIDLDPDGKPVIPVLAMPGVVFEDPVSTTIEKLQAPVDDALANTFPHIQSVIADNRDELSEGLQAKLHERLAALVDGSAARIAQAVAFLSMLLDRDISGIAASQFIDTGRPRTLRAALGEGYQFFDAITEFETGQRTQLTQARMDVLRKREWVDTLERQKMQLADSSEGAPATATIDAKITEARTELEQAESVRAQLESVVQQQDWLIESPHAAKTLQQQSEARITAETGASAAALADAKSAAETALAEQRAEEEAMRTYLFQAGIRIAGLILGLVALWALGLFLLPLVFGAIPVVGAPLFGFLGTVIQVAFTKWWGLGAIIAIIAAIIAAILRYLKMRSRLAELQAKVNAAKAAFAQSARVYWNSYVRRFTDPCNFIKYLGVFETEREIRDMADRSIKHLLALDEALNDAYRSLIERLADFKLESTATEFVTVDNEYLQQLVAERGQATKGLSLSFFDRVPFSGMLDAATADDAVVELMSQLHADSEAQLFNVLSEKSVVDLMRERDLRLSDIVSSVDTLLGVYPNAFKRSGTECAQHLWVLRGPDEEFLLQTASDVSPQPILIISDDKDSIAVMKIVHGLQPTDIIALAAQP